MDATALLNLEKSVQCSICLGTLDDPRSLPCQHTYCRLCLDNLLTFDANGSATLTCPMKCGGRTVIERNETTKILPKNFALANVLDVIKELKKSKTSDDRTTCSCKSQISKWCLSCRKMFCYTCYDLHECNSKSFMYGKYDEDVNELFQPLCEQHISTHITHICLDCNHCFICCYCINRNHKFHNVDTLKHAADDYKQKYFEELDRIDQQNLDFLYDDDVVADISKNHNEFELELNARIHLKVSSYIKKLTNEKDEILSEYKRAADNYLNNFKLSQKTFKQRLDSARENLKKQNTLETLAKRKVLEHQREHMKKLNVFKVSFEEDKGFGSLGTLKTQEFTRNLSEGCVGFEHDINMENQENFVEVFNESKLVIDDLQERTMRSFEKILQSYNMKEINHVIQTGNVQLFKELIFVKPKNLSNNLPHFIKEIIFNDQSNILDLLLKTYPDAVDIKMDNYNYIAPLFYAVQEVRKECVTVLLQNKADANIKNYNNWKCLHLAAMRGHHEIMKTLLQHGANVDCKGSDGQTPLINAVWYGHKECVNLLLQNNADVKVKDDYNRTCLRYAINTEIRTLLFQHGAI